MPRRRRRRAGDPREEDLRHDHDHRQPAADLPDDRHRQVHDALRDPAGLHQRAGQDEERDREQHERVDAAEDLDRKNDQAHAADAEQVGQRRQGERERQRQAQPRRSTRKPMTRTTSGAAPATSGIRTEAMRDARRPERPRERGSIAPRAQALAVELLHDLEGHQERAPPAGSRRSRRPRCRSREGSRLRSTR